MIHVGMGRESVPFPFLTLVLSIVGLVMGVVGVVEGDQYLLVGGLVAVLGPGAAAAGVRSHPVGHTPIPRVNLAPPPDRESFHLYRAREAYARGEITLERFDVLMRHVLDGGWLSKDLEPRGLDGARDPRDPVKRADPTYYLG